MLVLTRRPGEQIVIGNGIRVTVVSVGPGRVKIGIEAPADVRIDRQEIHDKIVHEQADHGNDVLASVGESVLTHDASPTLTAFAGDTSTGIPLREPIETATPVAVAASKTTRGLNRLIHRKPR